LQFAPGRAVRPRAEAARRGAAGAAAGRGRSGKCLNPRAARARRRLVHRGARGRGTAGTSLASGAARAALLTAARACPFLEIANMKPYTLTALAAAGLLGFGAATAQTVEQETTIRRTEDPVTGTTTQTTTTTTREFADLDVDHDGFLIVSEAAKDPAFQKVWVEYDKDGDKRITRVEYDDYRAVVLQKPVATTTTTVTKRQFVDFDTDADGYIVVNDLPRDEPFVKVWTTYDKDRDQRIARAEYEAYLIASAPATSTTTTTTTTTTRRDFVALDANADGYLVLEEIPKDNEFARVYVEYDKDGDKRITRTEYDAWYTVEVDAD
jgi:Ca2+-binding EF-hand superfamily protein